MLGSGLKYGEASGEGVIEAVDRPRTGEEEVEVREVLQTSRMGETLVRREL